MTLTSCQKIGVDKSILLSSTSPWYRLNSNNSVLFTDGIVFVEISDFSVPAAISGMTVFSTSNSFELKTSVAYHPKDGTKLLDEHGDNCLDFDITHKDIHDFLSSGSFLATVLDRYNVKLPSWLELTKSGKGLVAVQDLKTNLVFGKQVDEIPDCKGASVFDERLYNVFRFGTDMSFSVYGDRVEIPAPLQGNKFCIVLDICENNGGTLFFMLPPESRDLFDRSDFFESFSSDGLQFRPYGVGLSLTKDINVHYKTKSFLMWNGDEKYEHS